MTGFAAMPASAATVSAVYSGTHGWRGSSQPRKIVAVPVLALSTAGFSSAPSGAINDVLINYPARHVCVGHRFTVGVWYQSFSGHSRRYSVSVYNPQRVRILHKTGSAPSSHWRFWKIRPTESGKYHTIYRGTGAVPYVARFTTRAHYGCG